MGFWVHTYIYQFGVDYPDSLRTCFTHNLSFFAGAHSVSFMGPDLLLSTADVAWFSVPEKRV